jgi:hypothetical protein
MRRLLALGALGLCATSAGAQRRHYDDATTYWLSLSGGIANLQGVRDGRTNSIWAFGDAYPMRLTFARNIGSGNSIGLQYTYMRAPLVYRAPNGCGNCDAHATIAAYGPMLRLGGSGGTIHEVFEAFAGVMQYGSFTTDDGNAPLPPARPDRDFAFSFNFGIGYEMRRDLGFDLTFTQMRAMHEHTNLPNDVSTLAQHAALLFGVRMGF